MLRIRAGDGFQAAILVVHEVPTVGDILHVPRIENLRQSLSKISSNTKLHNAFLRKLKNEAQKHLSNKNDFLTFVQATNSIESMRIKHQALKRRDTLPKISTLNQLRPPANPSLDYFSV